MAHLHCLTVRTGDRVLLQWPQACYDSVDQRQVWARLQELAPHDQVLRVIRLLLDHWADKGNGGRPVGIAQGSAISPLLLNMQLTPLDRHMERSGVHYFRYADDLLLLVGEPVPVEL